MKRPETVPPSIRESLQHLRRLLWLVREYWGRLARTTLLALLGGAIGMVVPLITRLLVDSMYPARDIAMLNVLVLGIVTVMVVSAALAALRAQYTQLVSGQLSNALSLMFINHVQHLPIRFFDEHRVGEIVSRLGDVKSSLTTLTRVLSTCLLSTSYVILVPPILLWLNWRLALLSLVSVPLTTLLSFATARYLRRYWQQGAEAQADISSTQVDVLTHIRTLKLSGAERAVFNRLKGQMSHSLALQLHAGGVSSVVNIARGAIKATSTGICTWYGWSLILRQDITLGDYLAFAAYLGYLTGPVTELASLFVDFQRSSIALGRMFEYLDTKPEMDPLEVYDASTRPIAHVHGQLEMRGVTFGYRAAATVLQDVSLIIPPNSVTAIVGPSGAGKSSLIRVLCGIDAPCRGEVLLDGRSLLAYDKRELRQQISVVWQEAGIPRGSLRENLTLGVDTISPGLVDRALQVCRLDEWISTLPDGLDSQVAEGGVSMSAGQRQRFALARALIRQTPILMLDEATSNIDVQTELVLLRDLFTLTSTRTVIFVTHRVATAAAADLVCVVDGGRLVGSGPHPRLIESSDVYRDLLAAAQGGAEGMRLRSTRIPGLA